MFFSKSITNVYYFVWVLFLSLPLVAGAMTSIPPGPVTSNVKLINPMKFDTIQDLLGALLTIVIVIAVPIIVFFIIYAGFLYVTARGNAEQVKQATNALTYAVIGGVLIIGAMAMVTIIKSIVAPFVIP